jgi:hypothetical protein
MLAVVRKRLTAGVSVMIWLIFSSKITKNSLDLAQPFKNKINNFGIYFNIQKLPPETGQTCHE